MGNQALTMPLMPEPLCRDFFFPFLFFESFFYRDEGEAIVLHQGFLLLLLFKNDRFIN
jgi:hypothetical protein